MEYDENGVVTMFSNSQYRKNLYSGSLNDCTITAMENYDDEWETSHIKSYKYDSQLGKLIESCIISEYDDNRKVVISYDNFGRISKWCEFSGDSDGVYDNVMKPIAVGMQSISADETSWELEYSETYTYANDEVYTVGNSWHDLFGFDGPVTAVICEYINYDHTVTITFNRNDSGKIISADYNSSDLSYHSGYINVDADGHISEMEMHDYHTIYTWDGDMVVKSESDDNGWITNVLYEQGEGWHKAKYIYSDDLSSTDYEICEVRKSDNKHVVTYDSYYSGKLEESYSERFILETQQEDVAFVRPYINKDIEGMTVEEPIIISQAGRVICSSKTYSVEESSSIYSLNDWTDLDWIVPNAIEEFDDYYGLNSVAIYYSVEHIGNNTICSNADGLPIFVLDGNRLIKGKFYKLSYC